MKIVNVLIINVFIVSNTLKHPKMLEIWIDKLSLSGWKMAVYMIINSVSAAALPARSSFKNYSGKTVGTQSSSYKYPESFIEN